MNAIPLEVDNSDGLKRELKRDLYLVARHWMRYRDHSGRDRILVAARDRESGLWYAYTLPELSLMRCDGYPRCWSDFPGLRLWCDIWLRHWALEPEDWHPVERWSCLHVREELET